MRLPVSSDSWGSLSLDVTAHLMASSVTPVVSAPRCESLSVAVGVTGGGWVMAVVSSVLVEMGFNRFLTLQFMSAFMVGVSVVSIVVVTV